MAESQKKTRLKKKGASMVKVQMSKVWEFDCSKQMLMYFIAG